MSAQEGNETQQRLPACYQQQPLMGVDIEGKNIVTTARTLYALGRDIGRMEDLSDGVRQFTEQVMYLAGQIEKHAEAVVDCHDILDGRSKPSLPAQ